MPIPLPILDAPVSAVALNHLDALWFRVADPHFEVECVPVEYDHRRLAREMRDERLPEEFVETVLAGWWITCLEVLPSEERRRGRY